MIERPFWKQRIDRVWRDVPIAWLCGVRRCGKTTLAESFGADKILYLNCDLPSVEEMVKDPQLFFRGCEKPIVVFDEIHQLRDPARVLKIGADGFPKLRILATGSSTLAASKKFRDTLTGRKRLVHLTPVTWEELPAFGATLPKRLFHGGLPPALLAKSKSTAFYREWMDSFFARDIQRLFGFRDINRFNALLEYMLRQSGGQLEITKTATALRITRPTVESHLRALEITNAATLVRPFHGGNQHEVVKQPKVYAFDTGFVSFARGWDPIRQDDLGVLWEHMVLEHLQAHFPDTPAQYWRDKSGHEIDFVLAHRRDAVDVIECKWEPKAFDASALKIFRSHYPKGRNYLVTPSGDPAYNKRYGDLEVRVCTPTGARPVNGVVNLEALRETCSSLTWSDDRAFHHQMETVVHEEVVYVCGWKRAGDGFSLWVKSQPEVAVSAPTYVEANELLIKAIQNAGMAITPVFEFVPPLPKSVQESKYSDPEVYSIGGDDRFEPDAPKGSAFEPAEERELRLQWADKFFQSPICRKCESPNSPRSNEPLFLKCGSRRYDGAFGSPSHECRGTLHIYAAEFIDLLTAEEKHRLEFRKTLQKAKGRKFYELVGPAGPAEVAVTGLPISGWRCSQCSRKTWGYWIKGMEIHSFIAKSDLPCPLPGLFTIGTPPKVKLCARAERWQQLVGRWGTRGFTSSLIGIVSDLEAIRNPELLTQEECLAARKNR